MLQIRVVVYFAVYRRTRFVIILVKSRVRRQSVARDIVVIKLFVCGRRFHGYLNQSKVWCDSWSRVLGRVPLLLGWVCTITHRHLVSKNLPP